MSDVVWHCFDPSADLSQSQRNLPHWDQSGAVTFVTARLNDSMPHAVIERWHDEQVQWLRDNGYPHPDGQTFLEDRSVPSVVRQRFRKFRGRRWMAELDQCHGGCCLRRPELADEVAATFHHFDGERYDLDRFIVMPNHFHVLVQMRRPWSLTKQLTSWNHYSAARINRRLGRTGTLWRAEAFDHVVRSESQFDHLRRYIRENPIKGRVPDGQFLFWSRETGTVRAK